MEGKNSLVNAYSDFVPVIEQIIFPSAYWKIVWEQDYVTDYI